MAAVRQNWKRFAGQVAAGGALGAAAMAGILFTLEGRGLDTTNGGQMLAIVAGMVYALVGLVVGLGVLSPNTSWKLLNVEDADELREEGHRLWPSAVASVLIGVFFLALAAAPGDGAVGLVGNEAAAVIAGACLLGVVAVTFWTRRRTDELVRLISVEASATAMHVTVLGLGIWAALAHLGLAEWVGPLGLIAGLAMLQLVSVFVVCGRRGMLVPRS